MLTSGADALSSRTVSREKENGQSPLSCFGYLGCCECLAAVRVGELGAGRSGGQCGEAKDGDGARQRGSEEGKRGRCDCSADGRHTDRQGSGRARTKDFCADLWVLSRERRAWEEWTGPGAVGGSTARQQG